MVAGISAISLCVMPRSVSIVIDLTNVKCCRTAPLRMCHGENYFRTSGADRDRTGDPLLAKQVLSQLSYRPENSPR